MEETKVKTSEYWAKNPQIHATNHPNVQNREKIKEILTILISFISSLSLVLVIAVLIMQSLHNGTVLRCKDVGLESINKSTYSISNAILDVIRQELITRVINTQSSVQVALPVLINKKIQDLSLTIEKNSKVHQNSPTCSGVAALTHVEGIKPLDPDDYWRCPSGEPYLEDELTLSLIPGPSMLAGTSTIDGCVRLPSLAIGKSLYAYSSNLITKGCQDIGKSYQVLQLGIITLNSDLHPDLNPIISHTYDINDNRKSCSVAVSETKGYQLCSMPRVNEKTDYTSDGIEDIVFDVLDLKGSSRSFKFSNNDINFDHPFSALYPSVGSGIIWENELYFLGYGALTTALQGNTKCNLMGCPGATQDNCNKFISSSWLYSKQMVNVLIQIKGYLSNKPSIIVRTIPITENYVGAEGKLVGTRERIYIYTRSTGWHTNLQIGVLNINHPITITWKDHRVLSRPGRSPCAWNNKCPKNCTTGVYTDAYPISPDANYVATVTLLSNSTRTNPTIMYSSSDRVYNMLRLRNTELEAAYTTTSCIVHFDRGYCFHIIEINQKELNTLQPMLFKTAIPKACRISNL
nr:hemagglutinin protein [Respirovirus suis]UQS35873.1 hemagglutinin protein [Respirovirus suis]